jgi:dolichyl-phosphate-mannose-protein mannosyltransferase
VRGVRNPGSMIFDEFYASDACFYLHSSASLCGVPREITPVHPPLGKWLIALGIRTFGYDPTGWRIASVVAGTITIALVYVLGRMLLESILGAVVASGLLALDVLHFVMSRVAMLDVFVTFLSVAAFLCLAFDRDRLLSRTHGPPRRARSLDRPWRLASGALAGAAAACKWSGWLALLGVIVLTVGWELGARRRAGAEGALRRVAVEEGPTILIGLTVIPVLVYAATYAGRLDGTLLAWPWSEGSWVRSFVGRQLSMARFHVGLGGDNPYSSPAWSWLLLKRPVVMTLYQPAAGRIKEVMATGSPVVWWASLPALAFVVVRWVRGRRSASSHGFIIAGFAAALLPWLLLGVGRQQVFLFYVLPAVPFLCLALGAVAAHLWSTGAGRWAVGVFAVATVAMFVFLYPVLAAQPLSPSAWRARLLFTDCGGPIRPPPVAPVQTPTSGSTPRASTAPGSEAPAPAGWCWQ